MSSLSEGLDRRDRRRQPRFTTMDYEMTKIPGLSDLLDPHREEREREQISLAFEMIEHRRMAEAAIYHQRIADQEAVREAKSRFGVYKLPDMIGDFLFRPALNAIGSLLKRPVSTLIALVFTLGLVLAGAVALWFLIGVVSTGWFNIALKIFFWIGVCGAGGGAVSIAAAKAPDIEAGWYRFIVGRRGGVRHALMGIDSFLPLFVCLAIFLLERAGLRLMPSFSGLKGGAEAILALLWQAGYWFYGNKNPLYAVMDRFGRFRTI